jgi:hypothetical protein
MYHPAGTGPQSLQRIFHYYGNLTIAGGGLQDIATPAVTRDLSLSSFILRTIPCRRTSFSVKKNCVHDNKTWILLNDLIF